MLEEQEKQSIIKEYRLHDRDVGSPEVQIAILTHRINRLSKHLQRMPKDVHSKRGLLGLVSRRRKILDYLKKSDPLRYTALISRLGLRK